MQYYHKFALPSLYVCRWDCTSCVGGMPNRTRNLILTCIWPFKPSRNDFKDWWGSVFVHSSQQELAETAVILWSLWNNRNKILLVNKRLTSSSLIRQGFCNVRQLLTLTKLTRGLGALTELTEESLAVPLLSAFSLILWVWSASWKSIYWLSEFFSLVFLEAWRRREFLHRRIIRESFLSPADHRRG